MSTRSSSPQKNAGLPAHTIALLQSDSHHHEARPSLLTNFFSSGTPEPEDALKEVGPTAPAMFAPCDLNQGDIHNRQRHRPTEASSTWASSSCLSLTCASWCPTSEVWLCFFFFCLVAEMTTCRQSMASSQTFPSSITRGSIWQTGPTCGTFRKMLNPVNFGEL